MADYYGMQDAKYRGFDIPGMVKLHWESKPGRWWRKGVDSVLDSDIYEDIAEKAYMYEDLSE